jgi:cardiolipin synthase
MLVDDEALVVGSSNFDYFSFHTHQEVVAIVRDPGVIARYTRDLLQPDLAQSVAPAGEYSHIRQACREKVARLAGRAAVQISQWLRGWRSAPEFPSQVAPAQADPGVSSPE